MENNGVSVEFVANIIKQNGPEHVLILDSRPFMRFNEGHLPEATNIHCPPILKRRSNGFIPLVNIVPCEAKRNKLVDGKYKLVIVYDDDTSELSLAKKDSNLFSVLDSMTQQVSVPRLYYITGGYQKFQECYPQLCIAQQILLPSFLLSLPTPVVLPSPRREARNEPAEIFPHVYLGDSGHASQKELLKRIGFTAILNVSSNCVNHFPTDFEYMTIRVCDNSTADLSSWFDAAFNFMDSITENDGKVLVHCHAGVSRSVTICLAYLMFKSHLSLDLAYEHVRDRRSIIDPNLNFMQQLRRYESELRVSHSLKGCSQAERSFSSPGTPNTNTKITFSFPTPNFKLTVANASTPLVSPS
ncbi:hypothetical protein SNE40_017549 [Patella caerulea]|uniref:Protein-serine/threonine phosphatase n=1 Tax=Patella caerulea TaxID=87958 RepID=A0AAN8JF92_PATCE